ncbi:uncharacterized protein N7498_005989 [Penicillium cinerascens]|uniref:NADPH-dependent reductive aminase-like C-terminal domain-containing protein n=1 Tax=Penicillium cinerascens TaxID=70096 RepID=A0A9W9MPJ9_9EURO|nr:uncharacterized protein N7498_005989 [Penicillium cinerascens]KAJ5205110.1 hypothetical protein N7498_005989 [Penicillium cinerascens]
MVMNLSFSAYFHGANLASPELLGVPESPIYYAGDRRSFESMGNNLSILGRSIYLGDNPALASLIGCIMIDAFFGLASGFLQAVAVLKSSKLYTTRGAERFLFEEMAPLLSRNYFTLLGDYARQIDNRNYLRDDRKGMPLSLLVKTLENMNPTRSENGVSSVLFDPLLKLMQARVAQGGAAEEMSSLREVIPESGIPSDQTHEEVHYMDPTREGSASLYPG